MLRRQASTKVNLTRWQSGPRPGTRWPVRRQVNFIEGRSSFSVPRPLPTTLKTEERQVPRAAGAQSAVLLHMGFILKHGCGQPYKPYKEEENVKSGRLGRAECRRMG